ncbi:MAG: VIT1/CCC1 transporter family protein [Rubrivivax sp.]|jgi:VIT1/CCC1 family predicted Fe2+/Mn2+ transporter|nr:VIT1/CCC1 transporter family protein [Rubrivivax sp.]
MPADIEPPDGHRLLDPIDRNSEILFGLFMVLSFTGTLSAATAGREDVRTMLVAAIGCNAAWGFVDGVMHVLRTLVARGREAALARAVRAAERPELAHRLIAHDLGPPAEAFGPAELERARQWFVAHAQAAEDRPRLYARDLQAALGIFGLVFASTFPVVLPFVFVDDLWAAKRLSGAVAIAMLFLCGYNWGRHAGLRPWRTGLTMVLMGAGIEAVVIALGG